MANGDENPKQSESGTSGGTQLPPEINPLRQSEDVDLKEALEAEDTAQDVFSRFPYGTLNPWALAENRKAIDRNFSGDFISLLRGSTVGGLDHDIFADQYIFKAEVLYAWQQGPSKVGSSASALGLENLVHVKARIPELHNLPLPTALPAGGDPNDEAADWIRINAYPTFVSMDTLVSQFGIPQPGQIVYVGFECKNPFRGPLYLGPINKDNVFLPNPNIIPGAGTAFSTAGMYGSVSLPPVNPKPLAPGELPDNFLQGTYILFGDSQCRGALGRMVEIRMREYGLSPVPGYVRENSSRVGAQVGEFAFDVKLRRDLKNLRTTGIYDGGSTNGRSGPGVIEPFLKKGVKNVVFIGGGNDGSAGRSSSETTNAMKDIISNIKRIAGSHVKITLIGPPNHLKQNAETNKRRKRVADIWDEQASSDSQVYSFSPWRLWPDQSKNDVAPDGVHVNRPGAKRFIDRIFPPRRKDEPSATTGQTDLPPDLIDQTSESE